MNEGSPEKVRVVDRRKFTAEGERRENFAEEPTVAESSRPQQPPQAPNVADQTQAAQQSSAPPGLFEGLIGFLVENAMAALRAGATPAVIGQFIDLLEMLQKKTLGNLTEQEGRVLEETLGELKLLFLKYQKQPGGGGKP